MAGSGSDPVPGVMGPERSSQPAFSLIPYCGSGLREHRRTLRSNPRFSESRGTLPGGRENVTTI